MPGLTRRAAMLLPAAIPAMAYAAPEEQVLIGATYPLSGAVASAGDEMRQSIRSRRRSSIPRIRNSGTCRSAQRRGFRTWAGGR